MTAAKKIETQDEAHTAGPWNIVQDIHDGRIGISSDGGVVVFAPFKKDGLLSGVQGLANARLIAACPAMYDFIVHKARAGNADAISTLDALKLGY